MSHAVNSKIYTRKGDRGDTRLFSGETVSKNDLRVQAYGTLDELQAQLGMVRALVRHEAMQETVLRIQRELSVACTELASGAETVARLKRRIGKEDAGVLEKDIDGLVATYGLPQGFVVPGRSLDSAAAHVARTVCRRAERLVVEINREQHLFDDVSVYLNRLSDFLFALAWSLEVVCVVERVVTEVVEARK
jgi:cob(I)alamin adenosyltransferase